MGILLVYDVTDEASFNNIRNWMRNIEQHASDNVNKVHTELLLRVESPSADSFAPADSGGQQVRYGRREASCGV
jgi:Ras family